MTELIARNTIQSVLDGKFVAHAPGARFDIGGAEAESLVRMNAASYADPAAVPAPVVPTAEVVVAPQVLVETPAAAQVPVEVPATPAQPETLAELAQPTRPARSRNAATAAE